MSAQPCIQAVSFRTGTAGTVTHRHLQYQMIFVRKGTVSLTIDAREYEISRPSVVFISNLEAHALCIKSSVYERYILEIDPIGAHNSVKNPTLLSAFSNRPVGFRHVIDVAGIENEMDFYCNQILLAHTREYNPFPEEETLLLSAMLILLYRHAPQSFLPSYAGISNTVWEIKQELERNVQTEILLNDMAEKYHLSPYYLAHSFKRITGYSIKQYQLFCRISMSRELLMTTDWSITQISQRCGFSDVSNFSRYFRRILGCSPSEYRESKPTL